MFGEWAQQFDQLGLDAQAETRGAARAGVRRGVLHLARGTRHRDYSLRYGETVPLSAAGAGEEGRAPFVLTTYVASKTVDAFRRAGIQYLDRAGNAWIEFADVLIDVRGRPRPVAEGRARPVAGNLFSSGRAQVVFALLAWPALWDAPQRDLARAAGVSVGQANNTLKLLKQAGYTANGARPGQADLLDLWAAAYPTGLAHRITLAHYASDKPVQRKTLASASVSGAAAVPDLVRSLTAVLYVDELDPRLPIVNRWRSDGTPNIAVRHRFWVPPQPHTRNDDRDVAPWPLVYADLLASDDPRERTAAQASRERHLRPDRHA